MRIIRLVMPTDREPEDDMRAEIVINKDVALAIKSCRPGVVIAIDDVRGLAKRTDQRIEIIRAIFSRGGSLLTRSGVEITPAHEDLVVELLSSRRRELSSSEASQRGGHNRVDDEERARCLKFWNDHDLSAPQLEEYTGRSYSALRNWFAEEYPRPDKRGRPKKR